MIPNADTVALLPEARLYNSDIAIWEAAHNGYAQRTGCAVTAGAGFTVNVSAGIVWVAGVEVGVTAVTNLTLGSAPSGSNLRWSLIEVDASGTVSVHAGSDALVASVEPPTPTATSVVLAAVCIPASASAVEVYASGANNTAKAHIIDKRITHKRSYVVGRDATRHAITNPTSLTALQTASTAVLAANTIQVGDIFEIVWSANGIIHTTSHVQLQLTLGGTVTITDHNTATQTGGATLTSDASNNRRYSGRAHMICTAIGSGTSCNFAVIGKTEIGEAGGRDVNTQQASMAAGVLSAGVDSTGSLEIALKVKNATTDGSTTWTLDHFEVIKRPA